jgi:4-hydroxybenzoate polyprenyltransferase
LKNLLLFFPPFFGGKIFDPAVQTLIIPSFVSFSCAASCCYIINDIIDRETDRHHPEKKDRPLARGDVSVVFASIIAAVLYIIAMLISAGVSTRYEGYLIVYLLLTLGYTMYLKNIVIVDIFFIAFGFLVRVLAGGEAFRVGVSSWLFLTVFIVALFLATGKRLGEIITLGNEAAKHRNNLGQYTPSFLFGMLWFSAAAALVMYALYVVENKKEIIYTIPIAAFGLVRYIYIVNDGEGDPTAALLRDPQIMGAGIIWMFMIGIILYGKP